MATDWDLVARTNALEKRLANVRRELPGAEVPALAAVQSRADAVMAPLGERASPPMPGEDSLQYRKRLMRHLAPHSPRFKDTRFDSLDGPAIDAIEPHIYHDADVAARDTTKPGVLIPIEERDRSGRLITRYVGDMSVFLAPFSSGGQSGNFNPKFVG
jgi:hypothetical protein